MAWREAEGWEWEGWEEWEGEREAAFNSCRTVPGTNGQPFADESLPIRAKLLLGQPVLEARQHLHVDLADARLGQLELAGHLLAGQALQIVEP